MILNLNSLIVSMLLLVSISCSENKFNKYVIAVKALPGNIDPYSNQVNIYHYINLLIHYPMFEVKNNEYVSHFLDMKNTKSMNMDFDVFQMCLKKNIRYNDAKLIELSHLRESLIKAHDSIYGLSSIEYIKENSKNCLEVKLSKGDEDYFLKLRSVRSTVSNAGSRLGNYHIVKLDKEKILLQCTGKCLRFQQVEFKKIELPVEKSQLEGVDDFNNLWTHFDVDLTKVHMENFKSFTVETRRSLFILNKYKDKKLRNKINNCLGADNFIKLLGLKVKKDSSFLPKGVLGHIGESETKNQKICDLKNEIKIINFYHEKVNEYSELVKFYKKKNIRLNLVNMSYKEAVSKVFSDDEFIIVIMADAMIEEPFEYFTPFIKQPLVIDVAQTQISKTLKSDDLDHKTSLETSNKLLLETGYVMPLGRPVTTYYFHKDIEKIHFVDSVNGFLDLANIE